MRRANGAKKAPRGVFYFGVDRDETLKRFARDRESLKSSLGVKPDGAETIVGELMNCYVSTKRERMNWGELSPKMWTEYHRACEVMFETFGKNCRVVGLRHDDFGAMRRIRGTNLGPLAIGSFIQRVRTVFKYGFNAELIDVPIRFGPNFAKPSRRTLRIQKADKGVRMFEAEVVRTILTATSALLKAMILLCIKGGSGQTDCS